MRQRAARVHERLDRVVVLRVHEGNDLIINADDDITGQEIVLGQFTRGLQGVRARLAQVAVRVAEPVRLAAPTRAHGPGWRWRRVIGQRRDRYVSGVRGVGRVSHEQNPFLAVCRSERAISWRRRRGIQLWWSVRTSWW